MTRRARVRALAKVNLVLEVLHKRSDGYHELRTIFQTVSLADTVELSFTPGRRTEIAVESSVDIADNLVSRAAAAVLDTARIRGTVRVRLQKRIPMGAGLGGGSSDAAATLLALPVLLGVTIDEKRLEDISLTLGSDVGFFLQGGTQIGFGRGADLYATAEPARLHAVLATPPIHVSTAQAYAALNRPHGELTSLGSSPKINVSRAFASRLDLSADAWSFCRNDFEAVVFRRHPQLRSIKKHFETEGALAALMSGSGSCVFGVFASAEEARRAAGRVSGTETHVVNFVTRRAYRELWWRQLKEHIIERSWPPRSRYAR